jgi:hypothetical protein
MATGHAALDRLATDTDLHDRMSRNAAKIRGTHGTERAANLIEEIAQQTSI